MELNGLLLFTQKLATFLCLQPYQSCQHPRTIYFEKNFKITICTPRISNRSLSFRLPYPKSVHILLVHTSHSSRKHVTFFSPTPHIVFLHMPHSSRPYVTFFSPTRHILLVHASHSFRPHVTFFSPTRHIFLVNTSHSSRPHVTFFSPTRHILLAHTSHSSPISTSFIWQSKWSCVSRTNHEAPNHVIFSTQLLIPPIIHQCLAQHPFSKPTSIRAFDTH
jgi:hypothetical protein